MTFGVYCTSDCKDSFTNEIESFSVSLCLNRSLVDNSIVTLNKFTCINITNYHYFYCY